VTPEEKALIDVVLKRVELAEPMPRAVYLAAETLYRSYPGYPNLEQPAEWVPATFRDCLAGDRIRIGQQETIVRECSLGAWHVDNRDPWRPKGWEHTELRMDLEANPGLKEYPPATACEILMSPDRKAAHLLVQEFPGSQIVS